MREIQLIREVEQGDRPLILVAVIGAREERRRPRPRLTTAIGIMTAPQAESSRE
jgi:hypothetical protein